MITSRHTSRSGWARAAGYGAEVGAALALLYALAFMGYAVARSTINLLTTPAPDAGLVATLVATWVALAVPALVLGVLFAILAALLGALTALALKALVGRRSGAQTPRRALIVGVALCLAVGLALLALLGLRLGVRWSPATAETLTFWLVLPLATYVVAGGVASWRLGRELLGRSRLGREV